MVHWPLRGLSGRDGESGTGRRDTALWDQSSKIYVENNVLNQMRGVDLRITVS